MFQSISIRIGSKEQRQLGKTCMLSWAVHKFKGMCHKVVTLPQIYKIFLKTFKSSSLLGHPIQSKKTWVNSAKRWREGFICYDEFGTGKRGIARTPADISEGKLCKNNVWFLLTLPGNIRKPEVFRCFQGVSKEIKRCFYKVVSLKCLQESW